MATLAGSYNGLTFGAGTVNPRVDVITLDGIHDLPAVKAQDVARLSETGDFLGQDFVGGRDIVLGLRAICADNATYQAWLETAKTAFRPSLQTEPALMLWDSTKQVFCRPRKRHIPYDTAWYATFGNVVVDLHATDPRIYDANLSSLTPAAGAFNAPTNGNFGTRPSVHLVGPCTNFSITNVDTGQVIALNYVLAAGHYLDIDFAQKTLTVDATTSIRNSLTPASRWWELAPGVSHLSWAQTAGAGVVTFTYRSAWI